MQNPLTESVGDRAFLYEFDLHWRHYRMGYGRRTIVKSATDAADAIRQGRKQIAGCGDDFDLIELQRRSIVGRI